MYPADAPRVSVLVPCRNEAQHIGACLESVVATAYPHDRLEVLVLDGRSDDGTREIVARYAEHHPTIRLLDNPRRIVPTGLNLGIRAARGEVIVRMDAHVIYPPDYLPRLVAALRESGADNVGGVITTLPANDSPVARAIACALAHPFGVGNSYFRVGTTSPRWVDTVAFGCYRRDVFTRIGMFDEELVRNQDDEFNFRLRRAGGRILLVPDVAARYHARATRAELARMFYQYGYYKPLVARKVGRIMTLRQLAPPLFVLALALTAAASPWLGPARTLLGLLAGVYAVAVVASAVRAASAHGWRCAWSLATVFPVQHLGYGAGFLAGLVRLAWPRHTKTRDPAAVPLSRRSVSQERRPADAHQR